MKTLMTSFVRLAFSFLCTLAVFSCDPCSGVICNNGDCSNGSCICHAGYQKVGNGCQGVNMLYVGDGDQLAAQSTVDSSGTTIVTASGVGITLSASETDPYSFTILDFNNINNNNIDFIISSTDYEIVTSTTTLSGTYTVSGARIGTQVQLDITDANQITYKLAYTVN